MLRFKCAIETCKYSLTVVKDEFPKCSCCHNPMQPFCMFHEDIAMEVTESVN